MMVYKVGGIHTIHGKTGIAHLTEHLLFQKSKHYAQGEIDKITQYLGGFNNAYTCPDSTSFYYTFTTEYWHKSLEFLREQMCECQWTKRIIEKEKKIVQEEWSGYQDNHFEYLDQELDVLLFKETSYAYPILGFPNQLKNITLQDVQEFYITQYAPNNAILVIVGDVEAKQAMMLAQQYFGDIPSVPQPILNIPEYIPPTQTKELLLYKDINMVYFQFSWLLPNFTSQEDLIMNLLAIILGQGKSSRLYRKMMLQNSWLQNVGAISSLFQYLGKFSIYGSMLPSISTNKIKKNILQQIQKFQEKLITPYELQKAKNIYLSECISDQETNFSYAENIADEELYYGYKNIANIWQTIHSITEQDVQNLAKKYLAKETVLIGWLLPKTNTKKQIKHSKVKLIPQKKTKLKAPDRPIIYTPNISKKNQSKFQMFKYILDNGIQLFLLPNKTIPWTSIEVDIAPYHYPMDKKGKRGLGYLFGKLIGASKKYPQEKISEIVDYLGAEYLRGTLHLSTNSLSVDLPQMIDMIYHTFTDPLFEQKHLDRERVLMHSYLLRMQDIPEFHGLNEVRRILYKKHPLGSFFMDHVEDWQNITTQDLYDFHSQYFTPSQIMFAISGDMNPEKIYEQLQQKTKHWSGSTLEIQKLPKLYSLKKPVEKHIPRQISQLLIYYGYMGIRRTNPDYYKLLILERILGNSAGLTDRLTKKIREELGLCYDISFCLTSNADLEPGIMLAKIATSSRNKQLVLDALQNEIHILQQHGITEEELQSAKNYLKANILYSSQTNQSLASYLIMVEKYNLGFDYMYQFPNIIDAITTQDIQEVAQKYLHHSQSFTVSIGKTLKS